LKTVKKEAFWHFWRQLWCHWLIDSKHVSHHTTRIAKTYKNCLGVNPLKCYQKWKNWKNWKYPLKLWRFGDACHVFVTLHSSKAFQFTVLELQRFWQQNELCRSFLSRVIVLTDIQIHRSTDPQIHRSTDRRTQYFFALSCSGTSETSRKVIKSGGKNFFISTWFQYFGILMRAEVIKISF
jgi:hypothetical protein